MKTKIKNTKQKEQEIVVFHDATSRELIAAEGTTRIYIFDVFLSHGTHEMNLVIEPNKDSHIYVIILAKLLNKAVLTVHTNQFHDKTAGFSDFLCKVVLFGSTRFRYSGTINITKNGQHAHAYQRNENLLMSDSSYVSSEPKLEILANEVFCTHGATTGFVPSEMLYYLASRGLSEKKILRLVSGGFLSSGLDKIKEEFPDKYTDILNNLKVLSG